MLAQLSWRLLCLCSSPYSWVLTFSACLGMKDAHVFSQSCKLIYAGEILAEALLSNSVPYLYGFSYTNENGTGLQVGEKSMQCLRSPH